MNSSAQHRLLVEMKSLVESNLQNQQFSVEELAERMGMSRSHLHRKLKEATGQSVSQFIREYRLQKALELLQNGERTASEIAYQVGFSSATYFSKSFHDYYGYTPGEAKQKGIEAAVQLRDVPEPAPELAHKKKRRVNLLPRLGIALFAVGCVAILLFFVLRNNDTKLGAAVTDKSIAVLPFKNLSSETDNQYFSDGVMNAVLNKLSGIGELKVTPRTTVEKYRNNTAKTVSEIADELRVTYILEGSAQNYGDEIRITAELINAVNDQHIWSQNYTKKFEEVLHLQNEIAEKVAAELQAVLTTDEQAGLQQLTTKNPKAYNYYLLANYQSNKWTREGFRNARPLFEKAIAVDSSYVDAYVGLAHIWLIGGLVWGIYDEGEASNNTKSLLHKALALDTAHTEAYVKLAGTYFWYDWDFKKAAAYFGHAKNLKGYDGDIAMDFFIKIGKFKTALTTSEKYIGFDFLNSQYYHFKAEAYYFMGDTTAAIKTLDEVNSLFDNIFFVRETAKLYYVFGEMDKSKTALEKHKTLFPERPPIINWLDAVHAYHEGNNPQPYINQLKNQYKNQASGSPAWFLAMTYAVMDEVQPTFDWLEKSYARHEVEMTWLKMEPLLDPYKKNPRYLDLLGRMNFPE